MFRSERKNDKKLQEKLDDVEKKNLRLETRLRDIVQAYKSLQKEKDALESTVKALSQSSSSESRRKLKIANKNQTNQNAIQLSDAADSENKINDHSEQEHSVELDNDDDDDNHENGRTFEDAQGEISSLHEKIGTLSQALATVTEEKSKMEAAFQADRKLTIQEHEKRLREFEENMEMLETKNSELETNIQEMKSRLYQHQLELETEQNNNVLMLKEMQQLLAAERLEKEELKICLQEKREATTKSDDNTRIHKMKIEELSDELARVSSRLKNYETSAAEPSPLLLQLSQEMTGLKKHHLDALWQEQQRANEAEEALKQFSSVEEERIAVLEMKLAELSKTVGSYEKMRLEDQNVIQALKDRLVQLDASQTAATNAQQHQQHVDIDNDRNNQTIELEEEVRRLKSLIRSTWNKTKVESYYFENQPTSVAELDSILHNDPVHRACQLEYKQLKDEFENYKKEVQAFKMHSMSTDNPQELLTAKQNAENLEEELHNSKLVFHEKEEEYISTISNLTTDLKQLELTKEKEINDLKNNSRRDISQLETQLKKQRERTQYLLTDKDLEIKRLKSNSDISNPFEKTIFNSPCSEGPIVNEQSTDNDNTVKRSVETEVAVKQLLSRQNSAGSENSLMYYMQQMSHLQTEVASLRNQNLELESSVRDEEHSKEQIIEQMDTLKEVIRKLERDRSRENANLEYVKNIVLRYILSDSNSVKQQLTTTIGTVLQFSAEEMNGIRKKQNSWWNNQ